MAHGILGQMPSAGETHPAFALACGVILICMTCFKLHGRIWMREHAKTGTPWNGRWFGALLLHWSATLSVGWLGLCCLQLAWLAGSIPFVWLTIAKEGAMFGKLAGVVFGLGLSAILCMETNPNQPPLACLLGFSGITSLVIMVWLKATAAGLGLGQLQLFAICPTLPPF